jgi:hypothetical protein
MSNDETSRGGRATKGKSILVIVGGISCLLLYFLIDHYTGPSPAMKDFMSADTHRMEGKYDLAIAEFTKQIDKDHFSFAYNGRGESYRIKGDLDRAIADFDEAIRRSHDSFEPYRNRCRAFQAKGEIDRAIADCEEAIRLKPDHWDPHELIAQMLFARGDFDRAADKFGDIIRLQPTVAESYFYRGQIALFYQNRPAEAAEDLAKGVAGALSYRRIGGTMVAQAESGSVKDLMAYQHSFIPDGIYMIIWNHIARARAGQDDSKELAEHAEQFTLPIWEKLVFEKFENVTDEAQQKSLASWPGVIFGLFLGKTTPEVVRTAAEAQTDPQVRLRHVCDADFYLAEYYFEKGASDEARKLLQAAADRCPTSAREGAFAKAELKRLGL